MFLTLPSAQHPLKAPLLTVALLLQGCIALPIPHDRAISPMVSGLVRSQASGEPVADATVTITSHTGSAATKTDREGRYSVGIYERASWFVLVLAPAEGFCEGALAIEHPAYEPASVKISEFRGAAVDGKCRGYRREENVLLQPKRI